MGTMLQAMCSCGYKTGIFDQGGGMRSFKTVDMEPALCRKCKKVVVVNRMLAPNVCPKCKKEVTFYDSPTLHSGPEDDGHRWFGTVIPEGRCLCPRCGKMTLSFVSMGCFD
jgi:hypothetical protein